MSDQENLFAEFPPISYEEWKEKVIKDLKGKPFESLTWELGEGMVMEPFYTTSNDNSSILQAQKSSNDWEISEDFIVGKDLELENKQLLESLLGGVNAPRIILERNLGIQELATLFKTVEFSYISIHFWLSDEVDTTLFLDEFQSYLSQIGKDIKAIKGSIHGCDFQQGWQLKTLGIDVCEFYNGIENIPQELTQSIKLGVDHIMSVSNGKSDMNEVLASTFFSMKIGKSYFPAIAKIRALKLLWSRICEGFGTSYIKPEIEISFSMDAYDDNSNSNMIRATTMAMAAVIGGADRLIVLPSNITTEVPHTFSKRIARNVQHLLKMESFLDKVVDPASGSYYIERMTDLFVDKAWETFLKLENRSHQH